MARLKILIVDDSAELRASLKNLLGTDRNFEVIGEAADGRAAIELAGEVKPDVILMDVNMPVMDGLAATEKIVASNPDVIVIIMTVESDFQYLRRAMLAGAQDFLLKPFSNEDLRQAISKAYEKIKARRSAVEAAPQGHIMSLFSTKGGVGKSTIAVNLAVLLAKTFGKDRKVALLDFNFQFGDAGILLNIKNQTRNIHALVQEIGKPRAIDYELLENYMVTHEPSGLKVLLAPSKPQYAEEITMQHARFVLECVKNNFDYVIVDTSSYIRDIELTVFDWTELLLIVVTLELNTIKNVMLFFEILRDLNYPKEKYILILNRAFQKLGVDAELVEQKLTKISSFIPSDGEIVIQALNKGVPFVLEYGDEKGIVRAFKELAGVLVSEGDKGYFKLKDPVPGDGGVFQKFKRLFG